MAGQQAPTRIERIVTARYEPLVLPMPLNPMSVGEYKKYMPKFTGTEGVTTKEHLEAFYNYVDNLDISENDVWMRVFVQSLDGEARKCFRGLPQGSITNIEALDDAFLKQCGDKKNLLYYHTEFGNLKREKGEPLSDFNKIFNKMYSKIPAEVKPTPTTTKITYANSFDLDFCLLLRERRCATLNDMQEAALEVESNIMAEEKLKCQVDRRRLKGEASSSHASTSEPKLDKMTKMIESLATEISKLKVEYALGKTRLQNKFAPRNPNPFRKANEHLQIMQRGEEIKEDHKVKAPFQNAVMEGEQFDEDEDEIHCMEDNGSVVFLALAEYEQSLLQEQNSQEVKRIQ